MYQVQYNDLRMRNNSEGVTNLGTLVMRDRGGEGSWKPRDATLKMTRPVVYDTTSHIFTCYTYTLSDIHMYLCIGLKYQQE